MDDYQASVETLAAELGQVERVFRSLSGPDWATPTKLVPVDADLPHWTVFELAGHFDIAIGLTSMLIDGRGDSQPARDRTSFFINPRSETGPVVYQYAYAMVEGKTPEQMPDVLAETFRQVVAGARSMPASTVGPGYFAPMRVDEFVASRIVEAVVHGLDLTIALGREPVATPAGIAATAAILDDLLARRTTGRRPADLADDLTWVMAASGRADHPDNRLPLIG
ncbi:MAG TPA: maleylpyruvate isomerase N-terminal domain-containing protein [Streptosporangiaceae bacterium]